MKILGLEYNYQIGISLIDEQNKVLLVLLNQLMKVFMQDKIDKDYHKIYSTLMQHAHNSFDNEERIMERVKYPQLILHKSQHVEFINRIDLFGNEYLHRINNVYEFQKYLKKWYEGHIQVSDKKIVPYVLEKAKS